jgi:hypothetical protein
MNAPVSFPFLLLSFLPCSAHCRPSHLVNHDIKHNLPYANSSIRQSIKFTILFPLPSFLPSTSATQSTQLTKKTPPTLFFLPSPLHALFIPVAYFDSLFCYLIASPRYIYIYTHTNPKFQTKKNKDRARTPMYFFL